ncbi:triose-phosphate isomerase [Candidatus Woesearchaeota archaeon]|nr:triose-phosphate isomerase [Candidatus Woesearchaeota archaeon]
MARKLLIAANWKMHKTIPEAVDFAKKIKELKAERDILVCAPFTLLPAVAQELQGSSVGFGGQNMHFEEKGAFTGEISPLMLNELKCTHVIIGHSERRHVFGEDNALINKKIKSALAHNLIPVFCVGEKLEEREAGKTQDVVKEQIDKGLEGVENVDSVVIAYEPVWAIGTGKTATPDQAQEVHAFIREFMTELYSDDAANELRILYGGSVKPANVKELMSEKDIDGALVGGASLEFDSFSQLVNPQ